MTTFGWHHLRGTKGNPRGPPLPFISRFRHLFHPVIVVGALADLINYAGIIGLQESVFASPALVACTLPNRQFAVDRVT